MISDHDRRIAEAKEKAKTKQQATQRDVDFLRSRGYGPTDVLDAQRFLDSYYEQGCLASYLADRDKPKGGMY
jgi:hypothetical protein